MPATRMSVAVTTAIPRTWNGCAVGSGGSPIRPRMEFCHGAARQSDTIKTVALARTAQAAAIRAGRSGRNGNSRYDHSLRASSPMP